MTASTEEIPLERGVARLLTIVDPDGLAGLRRRFPHQAALLSSGEILGDAERDGPRDGAHDTNAKGMDRSQALLGLVDAGRRGLVGSMNDLLDRLGRRRRRVEKLRLVGALVTVSAGLAAAFITWFGEEILATFSACLATSGGLLTLVASHLEKSPTGLPIATAEEYGRLVEMRVEVDAVARRIGQNEITPLGETELIAMNNRLAAISDNVVRLNYSA